MAPMSEATILDAAPGSVDHGLGAKARKAAVWALLDKWVTRVITTSVFPVVSTT